MVKQGIFRFYKKEINRFNSMQTPPCRSTPYPMSRKMHTKPLPLHLKKRYGSAAWSHIERQNGNIHTFNIRRIKGRQASALFSTRNCTYPQLTHRLQNIFGEKLLIYHSKFSDNERVDIWKKTARHRRAMRNHRRAFFGVSSI